MKFFTNGLGQLIHKIESEEIKALVIYGPNQGFISSSLSLIEKKLSLNSSNYCAKDLTADRLSMIANSRNFFAKREIIKITDIPNTITKEMKDFLSKRETDLAFALAKNIAVSAADKLVQNFFFKSSSSISGGTIFNSTP